MPNVLRNCMDQGDCTRRVGLVFIYKLFATPHAMEKQAQEASDAAQKVERLTSDKKRDADRVAFQEELREARTDADAKHKEIMTQLAALTAERDHSHHEAAECRTKLEARPATAGAVLDVLIGLAREGKNVQNDPTRGTVWIEKARRIVKQVRNRAIIISTHLDSLACVFGSRIRLECSSNYCPVPNSSALLARI